MTWLFTRTIYCALHDGPSPVSWRRWRQRRARLRSAGLPARADTTVNWVGWQGYDEPLKLGSFLADNGIALATTYINTNEEIITRLQAGGAGQVDFITIYYGHIPILIAADLIEPIDESKVPAIADIFPEFLNVDTIRKDGKLYAVPFTWGTLSMVYDPAATAKPTSWKDALKDEYKGKVAHGRRRDRAARHLGADRHRHQDADPAHHGRAQEDDRFPHRHQEEPRPHLLGVLWRGGRSLRPRRGGDFRHRLGCDGRLRRRQGQGARLRHPGGGRHGVHGHARHPEGRAATATSPTRCSDSRSRPRARSRSPTR